MGSAGGKEGEKLILCKIRLFFKKQNKIKTRMTITLML